MLVMLKAALRGTEKDYEAEMPAGQGSSVRRRSTRRWGWGRNGSLADAKAPQGYDGSMEVGAVEWWFRWLFGEERTSDWVVELTIDEYLRRAKIYSAALMEVVVGPEKKEVSQRKRVLLASALNSLGSGAFGACASSQNSCLPYSFQLPLSSCAIFRSLNVVMPFSCMLHISSQHRRIVDDSYLLRV